MRPAFLIRADGADITALIADRLISLSVVDRAGVKSDRLTLDLDDRDQRIALPSKGAKLEVSLGYLPGQLVRVGQYIVDEVSVSGPVRTMSISANAADMTGTIKAPKERSFHGVTLGAIVYTVAAENGLIPAVAPELESKPMPHIDQTESDMQLLTRICADIGAVCKVADGRLVVGKHASGKTTGGAGGAGAPQDIPPAIISVGMCGSWSATLAGRAEYKSVTAVYQDTDSGERKEVAVGEGEPSIQLRETYPDQQAASDAANSKMQGLGASGGSVKISGMTGDANLAAETPVTLVGFRAGIDGPGWLAVGVTHSLSRGSFTTDIDLERK
jgi:uncharacterized protein